MASKAKTLQVKDKEKDDKAADAPEKDSAEAPSPLLDLSDAAVKKMIKQAKKRGFVTFDQLNEVLPSDTTSPEQIEDIMSGKPPRPPKDWTPAPVKPVGGVPPVTPGSATAVA